MNGVSLGIVSFSRCYAYFVHRSVFDVARHLAAKFGINLAVLIWQVYIISWNSLGGVFSCSSGKCYFHHM
jgi:hypothetical protein